MRTNKIKLNVATALVFTAIFGFSTTYAQLGGLKNAAKNAASKTIESKPKEEKKEDKKEDKKSESTSKSETPANVKIESSESGYDLAQKGDKEFEAEKYKEALAYYEEAEKRGHQDGMTKKRMRECKEALDPAVQEDNKKKMDFANLKMGELDAAKYKCSDMPVDNGISSPTHTKYLKKIVFSKSEIVKSQENEANFTNTFALTDNIYSRVYLEKSIRNEAGNVGNCFSPTYFIRYSFDDGATKMPEWLNVKVHNVLSGAADAVDKWTTWQPAVSWSAADLTGPELGVKNFVKYVRNLPAGTHKIKMEVVYDIPEDSNNGYSTYEYTTKFGPEKVLAVGEFTLNVTEADKKVLYKKVCPMYKTQIADYNRPAFTLVPNAVALAKITTGVDWKKFTLLKIVGDIDWTYKKNAYGIILSRSAGAGVYLLNNEDGFVYYSKAEYSQENTSSGGASYAATRVWVEEQNIEYTRNYDSFCKECIGK